MNLYHEELKQMWRQMLPQPVTSKMCLIKWLVSVKIAKFQNWIFWFHVVFFLSLNAHTQKIYHSTWYICTNLSFAKETNRSLYIYMFVLITVQCTKTKWYNLCHKDHFSLWKLTFLDIEPRWPCYFWWGQSVCNWSTGISFQKAPWRSEKPHVIKHQQHTHSYTQTLRAKPL